MVTLPVTVVLSFWGPWNSASRMPPGATGPKSREAAVSRPIEFPGAKRPPDWSVVAGRVPLPPMVPPALTVRLAEDAIEPLTESLAPASTTVAPV